jgi:hypothetical protein
VSLPGVQAGRFGESGLSAYGGGLYVATGTVTLINCTLANNMALGPSGTGGYIAGSGGSSYGGGFYQAAGTVQLLNCTISGNTNRAGNGAVGGYSNGRPGDGGGGAAFISGTCGWTNCTIASNRVFVGTGPDIPGLGANYGDGIYGWQSLTLLNNIITGHTNDLVAYTLTTFGYNLISSDRTPRALSDIVGLPARLGPLQDNGGPTWTHALLPGSPAIDAGNSSRVMTDQRGRPRAIHRVFVPNRGGDGSDIGAFEADNLITAIQVIGQNVRVQFMTASNHTYGVEYTTALPSSSWTALSENVVGTGNILSATNVGALGQPKRFYRVLQY